MKRILVPTDFSPCANTATQVALAIAQKTGAELYFLHICPEAVVESHFHSGVEFQYHHELISAAKSQLYSLVEQAEDRGIKAFQVLVFNKGTEKIENYVEPYQIDLVVMGSHGATGIREFVLGSNTQRVVRKVRVPVLVVKGIVETFNAKNIVFASTFRKDVSRAFGVICELAKEYSANLHIIFINPVNYIIEKEKAQKIVDRLVLAAGGINCSTSIADTNDPEYAINQYADALNADIVALTTHDRDQEFISHSVAEHMVNHEERPVLVMNSD